MAEMMSDYIGPKRTGTESIAENGSGNKHIVYLICALTMEKGQECDPWDFTGSTKSRNPCDGLASHPGGSRNTTETGDIKRRHGGPF